MSKKTRKITHGWTATVQEVMHLNMMEAIRRDPELKRLWDKAKKAHEGINDEER